MISNEEIDQAIFITEAKLKGPIRALNTGNALILNNQVLILKMLRELYAK